MKLCGCECKVPNVLIVRLGFESQQDRLTFFLHSAFLSNLFKGVLTLKIRYLLKS